MAKRDTYYGDDQEEQPKEDKGGGGASATLPKSLLMGKSFEVGDELVLRVTAVHDDQVVVENASEKPAAEETKEETPETPPETEEETAMAEEGAPAEVSGGLYD